MSGRKVQQSGEKFYELAKSSRAVVRVRTDRFQGQHRLDLREYVDIDGDGVRRPTRKGVNLPIAQLPALRAALEAAEAEALKAGNLEIEDYTEAGLSIPAELKEPA